MANILIAEPLPIAALATSRGTGGANLLTADPREAWTDSAVGTAATISIDLGVERIVDTLFLGCIFNAALDATWTITGGVTGYNDITVKPLSALCVPDRGARLRTMNHALWTGAEHMVRYLRVAVAQPAGAPPLAIGALVVSGAFVPTWNKEWGSGRGVKDSATVTRLPSGGVAVAHGARFGTYAWTLGDLSDEEADILYELQLGVGESRPLLVVEDPAATEGLRNRIHYGGLTSLRAFDRRNPAQTSWQLSIEDWALEPSQVAQPTTIPALTLGGVPLTLGGDILTLGV